MLAGRRDRLRLRWRAGDLLLLGVATHKLSRIVTRDWVTAPLRAAFARYERSAGHGEVDETSCGHGVRRAVGDLLTCPFCSGPWVAATLVSMFVARPRVTRTIAATFVITATSDWLHRLYARRG